MAIGTTAALIMGGTALAGAGASAMAASKAAKAQKGAANTAANAEREMFDQTRLDNEEFYQRGRSDLERNFDVAGQRLEPYNRYGAEANDRLAALAGMNGSRALTDALAQDPGYQFRMSQGVNALDRSAAARGLLQSGAQQKALTQYGQGLASDELNNAYSRVNGVLNNTQQAATALSNISMGRGTALANLSQGQASQNQSLGMNTSNALGNYATQAGQAQAGAYQNMGSALNGGLQNGLTAYMMRPQGSAYGNNYGPIGGRPYNGPR